MGEQEPASSGAGAGGQGFRVSHKLVGRLLAQLGYSLQANRKTREGGQPSRSRRAVRAHQRAGQRRSGGGQPVDLGRYEEEGTGRRLQERRARVAAQGRPEPVRVHDFVDPELGKAIPYGVYDIAANAGWVSVGIDHDTAAFAVDSIRRWWQTFGKSRYPEAKRLPDALLQLGA